MAATYTTASPYYSTGFTQFYLDVMVDRPIPKETDDLEFEINQTYQYRPDLLAYDLYGDGSLWWVFYQRNPNSLTAPVIDFVIGKKIFLPKISVLQQSLGI
jgi:hypothetical protein